MRTVRAEHASRLGQSGGSHTGDPPHRCPYTTCSSQPSPQVAERLARKSDVAHACGRLGGTVGVRFARPREL
jgi:hypothetical protein